ncbi:MAG TPA: serine/threonine-protein kinase [Candidatus Hydrogenedens sp.]|nr:serine/threonine-protein kinase [Candidatus Hydrogenedens sp.]
METGEPQIPNGKESYTIADRYEVLKPLGRGGMGKVFLVQDKQTKQKLALKLMRAQYQHNQKAIARFLREVEAVRQLNHPCIVKIFDAQIEGEQLFYTMEYVDGRSVRDWLTNKGPLSFGNTVRILALVADALEHAHKITIHRDISPDNVMVCRDGTVRLMDFGLAKLADDQTPLTMVGVNLGKIQYSAPEQRKNAAGVDKRADIYPLGVMFFEMLIGRRPQPGDKLSKLRPDLPKGCDEFLEKATASNPDERFQSAKEFRNALLNLYKQWKEENELKEQKRVSSFNPFAVLKSFIKVLQNIIDKMGSIFHRE